MTVSDLVNSLQEYDGDTEVVIVRIGDRASKYPEAVDKVMDGADLCGYDKEFAGKVVIW